jgi:drug/metabolite transporter (DMT)-like permease
MFKKKITLKILLFLIFSDILETCTHFFFKVSTCYEGDTEITNAIGFFMFIREVFTSPYLWMGLLSVFLTFVVWSTILSKIDLSVAVPIASFSYILVPLISMVFLHETIPPLRWAGIIFILAGVIVVSSSSEEKEVLLP